MVTAIALATGAALLGTGSAGPAVADSTTPGSALSQSATVTNGSGISLSAAGTGLSGSLTSALLNSALAAGTANLPNTVATSATTALTSTAGLQATNASTRQDRPAPVDNYPTCNTQAWVSPNGNCYAVVPTTGTPTLPGGSLLALSAGTVQGYATGDAQGYVAASGSSHPILAVPGLALDLGVASSDVQCTVSLVCTPTQAFTGGTITTTAGAQSFALATGSSLATVGGTTIASGATRSLVPNLVSVTANGNFLTFNVTLSLTQYLTILGTTLAALSTGLSGLLNDNGTTITMAVSVGPGSVTGKGSSTASTWGLEVGVNLIVDIKLNLNALGLGGLLGGLLGTTELKTAGASNYPTAAGSSPNLLDLKFAYSQATAGALLPDFVPPGLI